MWEDVEKPCGKMCYGQIRPRFNFLAIIPKGMFGTKEPKRHNPHCEARWRQCHALGMLFISWN